MEIMSLGRKAFLLKARGPVRPPLYTPFEQFFMKEMKKSPSFLGSPSNSACISSTFSYSALRSL